MLTDKNKACCFAGHRKLPEAKIERIILNLNREVENCIANGVTTFISGGALGFDQMAASLIIAKKEMGYKIRLIFVLPCKNQDELWTNEQKRLYHGILAEADETIYVSQEFTPNCMKIRNYYMVDHSAYCICALSEWMSGTGQTIRYAKKKGLKVNNTISP